MYIMYKIIFSVMHKYCCRFYYRKLCICKENNEICLDKIGHFPTIFL